LTQERRQVPRFRIESAIAVEHGTGMTLNLSSRGVFFETTLPLKPGDAIAIVFPFEQTGPGASVRCSARVVRVEARDDRFAVAATYEPVAFSVPA
jgi:hypothetical protein